VSENFRRESLEKLSAIASFRGRGAPKEPRTFDFTFVHAAHPGVKSPKRRGCNRWHVLSAAAPLPFSSRSHPLRSRARSSSRRRTIQPRDYLVVIIDPFFLRKGFTNPPVAMSNEFPFTVDREPAASRAEAARRSPVIKFGPPLVYTTCTAE